MVNTLFGNKDEKKITMKQQTQLWPELKELLDNSATINANFGYSADMTKREAEDTPLTFAVKQKNFPLMEFLLYMAQIRKYSNLGNS